MLLPKMTELLLALTRGFVPGALLVALTFLVVDCVGYLAFGRSWTRWALWTLWSSVMTVAPIVVILLTIVALWVPWMKLQEGLSK